MKRSPLHIPWRSIPIIVVGDCTNTHWKCPSGPLWHLVGWRRTPTSMLTSQCFEGSTHILKTHCKNIYILCELRVKVGTDSDMHLQVRCMSRPASLLVGSPWQSDLLCALDVGRELNRLHSLNGAEANNMFSLGRYSNELIVFCVLLTVMNKLIHVRITKPLVSWFFLEPEFVFGESKVRLRVKVQHEGVPNAQWFTNQPCFDIIAASRHIHVSIYREWLIPVDFVLTTDPLDIV